MYYPCMQVVRAEQGGTQASKRFVRGTHRAQCPAETLERVLPLLPKFGITRVANVTGMDCIGIDTVMVVRPNARSVSVSQGKGADLDSAKASGVMESIEQYHAEHILQPLRLCSAQELAASERVIDVSRLPRFARAYSPTLRTSWIEGVELGAEQKVWLPYELVHLDLRLPLPTGSGYFLSGSNGLASGNHLLEAINHGLCELIERDALTLFFGGGAAAQLERRLDLASVDDPLCLELLDKYRAAAVDVAVWDATSDVGVPCFLCWILDSKDESFRAVGLAQGAGCHPERAVALARALCEAAQSRLTRVVGSRDDIQDHELELLRSAETTALHRFSMREPDAASRRFGEVCTHALDTFEADLALLRAQLRRAGVHEVVVVDLSAGHPLHVVRVVAPGLEAPSYLPGYHPGRRAQLASQAAPHA
jgi:YcaO-like protein with predicted kinase domain